MAEAGDGCVTAAKGPIRAAESSQPVAAAPADGKEGRMTVRVGKEAPDFEASAFVDGGFKNIQLSNYRGEWVVLCFYPGDFTFV